MLQQWDNLYFEGKVRSKNSTADGQRATEGEIDPGEYTFSTTSEEHMTVNSGILWAMPEGENEFRPYNNGQTFIVPANSSFKVKAEVLVKYLCVYINK